METREDLKAPRQERDAIQGRLNREISIRNAAEHAILATEDDIRDVKQAIKDAGDIVVVGTEPETERRSKQWYEKRLVDLKEMLQIEKDDLEEKQENVDSLEEGLEEVEAKIDKLEDELVKKEDEDGVK